MAFHVRCFVCNAAMLEIPTLSDSELHLFWCPNNCPGAQRVICGGTTTQKDLDEEYYRHLLAKAALDKKISG